MKLVGVRQLILCAAILCWVAACRTDPTSAPQSAGILPTPDDPVECAYLGLPTNAPAFRVSDIESEIVLVAFFDMYCRDCHKAAPGLVAMHELVAERDLDGRIKMLAVGVGNTELEVNVYKRRFKTPFPVFEDDDKQASFAMRCERTPSLVAFRKDEEGQVHEFYRRYGAFTDARAMLGLVLRRAGLE